MALASVLANSVQTVHDREKVARMTQRMKTVCVGRFLIDLPVEAQVAIHGGFVSGFDFVSSIEESEADFAGRLREFETGVEDAARKAHRRPFETVFPLVAHARYGKAFVYNRRIVQTMENRKIIDIEDVDAFGMLRHGDVSITASSEGAALDVGPRLEHALTQIRPLGRGEIPRESGFCLAHALLRDPYEHRGNERIVMFAGFPGHPDVNIVFSSMAGAAPAPGLIDRNAKAAAREPLHVRMALTTLREGERVVNDLQGEEVLIRAREANFTTGYGFEWEMRGGRNDIFEPNLTLELESGTNPVTGGRPLQSTLSEDAMLALWESIVSTIRLRPFDAEQAQLPAPVALGTGAFAGDVCPQTGWWQCGDGGQGLGVLGGQRQFLRQGQRMPQALLLPPQTMWERLRGMQPSFESRLPTLWTLNDKRGSARIPAFSGLAQAIAASAPGTVPAGGAPAGRAETPIGSVAATGASCPASGWWRCQESHALDGTRWFAAGSLLPAATFRAPPHGRGAAHAGVVHRRSSWQLVRRAPHDTDGPAPA